eukprot:1957958-Rhodomonas_salina.3
MALHGSSYAVSGTDIAYDALLGEAEAMNGHKGLWQGTSLPEVKSKQPLFQYNLHQDCGC